MRLARQTSSMDDHFWVDNENSQFIISGSVGNSAHNKGRLIKLSMILMADLFVDAQLRMMRFKSFKNQIKARKTPDSG